MPELPRGTVAFLFTDIEGSTRRWERDTAAMRAAVERHFAILDRAILAEGGARYKTIGDAVQAAFPAVSGAVAAALATQRALEAEPWGEIGPLRVRMAIHVGEAEPRDGDYLAPALNRLARLLAAGHGGQILLTMAAAALARAALPAGGSLRDLGEHRLRDLQRAEPVFQLLHSDLPGEFPPLESLDIQRHNLPLQPTPFIGRDAEVGGLVALLQQPDARLVTLVGPGGVGKTRLALEVAGRLLERFPDGVWFVDLAPLQEAALVPQAIANALGVPEEPGRSLREALREHLAARSLLLVLDNVEQLIEAAPDISALLDASPASKALVTSRAPLRLRGERERPVPPLGVPARTALPSPDLAEIAASDAVRLFVARAEAVRPGFALTPETMPDIVEICRRLDGLPLAIELAAARVRLLPPKQLLARLDDRLRLLAGGPRDAPARHQTLRQTIAWSHDLLSPNEQALFRRLAVFAGGFTLEAAEDVGGDGPWASGGDGFASGGGGEQERTSSPLLPLSAAAPPERSVTPSVLDLLASLAEQSLIQQTGAADGEPRFGMLQTIRAFGLEELAARGEEEGVREEHAAFFAGMVARARPELSGPEQGAWFDRFDVEHDDIRAALRWLLRRRETDVALRLVGVLWAFWWIRGYPGEGSDWLRQALALDGASDSATRALALAGAGTLAEVQGDYDRAAALHAESLALARANGSDLDAARALSGLAAIAQDQGDYDQAAARFAEALALYRQAGDETGIAQALIGLGTLAAYRGESEEAAQRLAEAVAQFTALGDDWGVAHARLNLGRLAFLDGDIERAGRESEEALTIFRRLGDAANIALLLANLGEIALHQGEIARAAELHDDALARFRALGDSRNIAATLVTRAEVEAARGDGEAAERLLRESLRLALALDDKEGIARALDAFAGVVVAGDPALARQSLDAADTLRAAIGAPLPAIYRSARERLRASASANLPSPAHVQEAPCSARPVEEIIASVLDFTRKLSSETSTQLNRAG